MNFSSICMIFVLCTLNCFSMFFFNIFLLWETCLIFCSYCFSLCRRGNNHFDVQFSRFGPVFFRRKIGKTRSVREEMDRRVFISRQSRHPFCLIKNMIKVLFPICTLIWRVKNYVSRQGKV